MSRPDLSCLCGYRAADADDLAEHLRQAEEAFLADPSSLGRLCAAESGGQ